MKSLRGTFALLLTAFIWGVAFVAQQVGGETLGAFSFNGIRSFIGSAVLIPVVWFINRGKTDAQREAVSLKATVIGGIVCGTLLFTASSLQQVGLLYTTVGKAGFITALYIVCVPVFSIFLGKKCGLRIWVAVAIAVIGLYLLCMTGGLYLSRGDALMVLCAFAFSCHILCVDYFCVRSDNVMMSCIQFFTCGTLSVLPMLLLEHPTAAQMQAALIPLLYAGVLSCGVAYTLQIVGQKYVNPAAASIIMSLEAVFSVLAGWVILHQTMTGRELLGCTLMFSASVLAQLPGKKAEVQTDSAEEAL